MIDAITLLEKYTRDNPELYRTLLGHSRAVCDKAIAIIERKNLSLDRQFVEEAAMLHDIGVVRCDAPSIYCFGSAPYICHGIEGRAILEAEGLPRHALVCERHTGSGISASQIKENGLPLPARDMLPLSPEEKLICYADKFFSKSRELDKEKPLEKIMAQMQAHGQEAYRRFIDLHTLFV